MTMGRVVALWRVALGVALVGAGCDAPGTGGGGWMPPLDADEVSASEVEGGGDAREDDLGGEADAPVGDAPVGDAQAGDAEDGDAAPREDGTPGEDAADPADAGTDANGEDVGPELPPPDPKGPNILSLSTTGKVLRPGLAVTVSAIVGDPDGTSDIAGGQLADPNSEGVYGVFAAAGAEGAYSLTLTWESVGAVAAIQAPAGGVARTFVATFFDNGGLTASQALTLKLECATASDGICGGVCADFDTDLEHCGGCGQPVPAGTGQVCLGGQVACPMGQTLCAGSCVDTQTHPTHCGGCNQPVGAGQTCVGGKPTCPMGQKFCGGGCVNPAIHPAHCGDCGVVADASRGFVCQGGQVVCHAGTTQCGDSCVDLDWDDAHCGDCDRPVPEGATCSYGEPQCPWSQALCPEACLTLDSVSSCGQCDMVRNCSDVAIAAGYDAGSLWNLDYGCSERHCWLNAALWPSSTPRSCNALCAEMGMVCFSSAEEPWASKAWSKAYDCTYAANDDTRVLSNHGPHDPCLRTRYDSSCGSSCTQSTYTIYKVGCDLVPTTAALNPYELANLYCTCRTE